MSDYIIIVEIPKLKLNPHQSLKIQGPKNTFYIYSDDIIPTLAEYNKILKQCRESSLTEFSGPGDFRFIEKQNNCFFFIVFKAEVDLNMNGEDIRKSVRNHLNSLLSLFSFIYREIFSIHKIFIFKPEKNIYTFLRMLETPPWENQTSDTSQLIRFITGKWIETVFPWLITRLCRKKQFIPFIEEYITGRIKSPYVETDIMMNWNTLEHLANLFWASLGKTKFVEKAKLRRINRCIKTMVESIEDSEILFPSIKKEDIARKNLLQLNNIPPIKEKVFSMCNKLHLRLSEEIIDLIDKIYYLRNKLFHEVFHLEDLLDKFSRKYGPANLRDLTFLSDKFQLLLEKIFLKLFRFIPYYFEIPRQEEYYHHITLKKINLPSYHEQVKKRKKEIDERFDKKRIEGMSPQEFIALNCTNDKMDLFHNGKYIPLLKFIERFKQRLKGLLQDDYLKGNIIHDTNTKEIQVKFLENLHGQFKLMTNDTAFIHQMDTNNLSFRSSENISCPGYELSFNMLLKNLTHDLFTPSAEQEMTGSFLTLMIDLKKIASN